MTKTWPEVTPGFPYAICFGSWSCWSPKWDQSHITRCIADGNPTALHSLWTLLGAVTVIYAVDLLLYIWYCGDWFLFWEILVVFSQILQPLGTDVMCHLGWLFREQRFYPLSFCLFSILSFVYLPVLWAIFFSSLYRLRWCQSFIFLNLLSWSWLPDQGDPSFFTRGMHAALFDHVATHLQDYNNCCIYQFIFLTYSVIRTLLACASMLSDGIFPQSLVYWSQWLCPFSLPPISQCALKWKGCVNAASVVGFTFCSFSRSCWLPLHVVVVKLWD